jgi:hypothetical protein
MKTYKVKVHTIETYVVKAEDGGRAKAEMLIHSSLSRSHIPDRYRLAQMERVIVVAEEVPDDYRIPKPEVMVRARGLHDPGPDPRD